MRVSDERYNGMIQFYKQLVGDCNQVQTLEAFRDRFENEYDIDDSNLEDGMLTVEDCGDLYTINDTPYGLEVSQDVEITDPVMRAPVDIYLDDNDIYG